MIEDILREDLIMAPLSVKNREEALILLAERLRQQGYVKEEYAKRVLMREKEYPTGLPLGSVNLALPHTDVEQVIKPGLAVGVLTSPMLFANMIKPQEEIPVSLIFMLAVQSPPNQAAFMQKLFSLFWQEDFLLSLVRAGSPQAVYQLLASGLGLDFKRFAGGGNHAR